MDQSAFSADKIITDLEEVRKEQTECQVKIDKLQKENQALWKQYSMINSKFIKQQNILEKVRKNSVICYFFFINMYYKCFSWFPF